MTAIPKLTTTCAGLIGAGLPSGGTDMPCVSTAMTASCTRHQSTCDGDEGIGHGSTTAARYQPSPLDPTGKTRDFITVPRPTRWP